MTARNAAIAGSLKSNSRELAEGLRLVDYDSAGTSGVVEPDGVSGVHPGVGGVFERDYRDANRDSRPRSLHAESGWERCGGGEPGVARQRADFASRRPRLQRRAD